MITKKEFDIVQSILGKKGKPRPKDKRLPFNGVIKCGECGGMITSVEKIKYVKSENKMKSYIYHRCTKRKKGKTCHQKAIKHEDLANQISEYLNAISIPKEFLHWALEILRKQNKVEETNRNIVINNLQKNYQRCVAKIDNLINLYISPDNADRELLSEAEFKKRKNELMREKAGLESDTRDTERRIEEWVELN